MVALHPGVTGRRHHRWNLQAQLRSLLLIAFAALALLWTASVSAENTVSLTILPAGPLSAAVLDGGLYPIVASNQEQRDTGTLSLVINDRRGTSEGWSVSIAASDFTYLGDSPFGQDIPSRGFRVVSIAIPLALAGQPVGEYGPHPMPIAGLSLDTPRTVVWAAPGGGSGDYEQLIGVELIIPAGSHPGLYLSNLTIAFASAP